VDEDCVTHLMTLRGRNRGRSVAGGKEGSKKDTQNCYKPTGQRKGEKDTEREKAGRLIVNGASGPKEVVKARGVEKIG